MKKDSSPIRDVFLQKMSGVQIQVRGKGYPAITTRDTILSTYKKAENKSSLSNAVAFDAKQYDKIRTTLAAVESTSESTAK